MSELESIGEVYDQWWQAIGPKGCAPVQREEMRRSFYSGAFAMFLMIRKVADLPKKAAVQQMKEWDAELHAFTNTLMFMAEHKDKP